MEWNLQNKTIRPGFVAGIIFLFLVIVTTLGVGFGGYFLYEEIIVDEESDFSSSDESFDCNVFAERIHGTLDTYTPINTSPEVGDIYASEDIVYNIELAEKSPEIKAVLIDIDSLGGYAVAADEVAKALKALTKPSVAVIRGYGDSAAYWAATGADIIFAHPLSDVGSIGITQSYLENVGYNAKEGFTYQQLSLGKYKDLGDPNKPLTAEEKQIVMRQLEQNYEYFIATVAANRNMPMEEVRKLATGESWTGTDALELKLVDKLGGLPEATKWLEEQIGAKPEICW